VFRIERANGEGLYGICEGAEYKDSLAASLPEYFGFYGRAWQPPPSEDGLTRADTVEGMLYGFAGIGQMCNWLGDCPFDELYAKGGRVIVLDVKEAQFGYSQCRFYPESVIFRETLTLQEIEQELPYVNVQRFAA
jgi:hypothetical protein